MSFNKNVFSETLKSILETGQGFRNENYGASGIYRIKDIIEYEILELNNTDILYTLNKFGYKLKFDLNSVFEVLSDYFSESIFNLYGIWLTGEKSVKQIYCYNPNHLEYYNRYNIKDVKVMPISDLDKDGCLFVIKEFPRNLIVETKLATK